MRMPQPSALLPGARITDNLFLPCPRELSPLIPPMPSPPINNAWKRTSRPATAPHLAAVAVLALMAGCASVGTWQRADITQPGWKVRQGQATWTPGHAQPPITGELLLATGPAGTLFVQFSKPPFVLVTGEAANGRWRIEYPLQRRTSTGRGVFPRNRAWFTLPQLLASPKRPPPGWNAQHKPDGTWSIWSSASGERLDGFLNP